MFRGHALIVAVLILTAGCGGGSSSGDPDVVATTAGDTTTFTVADAGFSIATPASWKGVDSATADKAIAETSDPQIKSLFEQLSESGVGIRFVAADSEIADGFATNVNVVTEPLPAGMDLAGYSDANVQLITQLFQGVTPERASVTLPAGPATRLEYTREANGVELRQIQYFLTDADTGYVITFSTTPGTGSKYDGIFQQSAESFRFL